MRKVAYTDSHPDVLKLMIYDSDDEVYLFGYDDLADTSCIWDEWFTSVDEAEERAADKYNVDLSDWIEIANPCATCKHDLISSSIIGFNNEKLKSFQALTGNERLYVSGLMEELTVLKLLIYLKHPALMLHPLLQYFESPINSSQLIKSSIN